MRGVGSLKPIALGDQIARVEAWCRNGRSPRHAAAALGITESSMRQWLVKRGYRARDGYTRREWKLREIELMRQRAAEWSSANDAAQELGRELRPVYKAAAEHGIRFSSRHRWTAGQKRVITEQVDRLIAHLTQRLGIDEGAIAQRVIKDCMYREKRRKAQSIADVGGMHSYLGNVKPKGTAA